MDASPFRVPALCGSLAVAVTLLAASAPQASAAGTTYAVRAGDTLSAIARSHHVTLAALEAANPRIGDPNALRVGQRLTIPDASPPARTTPVRRTQPVTTRRVGTSVQGRAITAYEVGDPKGTRVLLLGQMHGNEDAGVAIANRLVALARAGHRVAGVDLWVVPTMNPDGDVHQTRRNAHGVDLNRNFSYAWSASRNVDNPGPRAASEPETRAMSAFIQWLHPVRMVSVHQPFNAVDTYDLKNASLEKALTRNLHLAARYMSCQGSDGRCHGTLTQWVNHTTAGAAITVEFPASVSATYTNSVAVPGLVAALGGH